MSQATIHQYASDPRKVIFVGVPTFGMVSIQWHTYTMQLKAPMNRILRHAIVQGREVGDARNVIVQQALGYRGALGERCGWLFFIDDDVLIPPHALIRLLEHRRPIVSGLYYTKTDPSQPLLLHGRYDGAAIEWTPGSLVDCYGHGMGCTLIDIDVFEKTYRQGLIETGEESCSVCGGSGGPKGTPCGGCFGTGKVLKFFSTTRDRAISPEGIPVLLHQTEDLYFLERAKQAGFQPSVDTGCFCWHWDAASQQAFPIKQWAEYRSAGTITWETANGPVTWRGQTPASGVAA